jgi:hypothetical protein
VNSSHTSTIARRSEHKTARRCAQDTAW